MSHSKFTIQDWYFSFAIALLLKQPGCLPVEMAVSCALCWCEAALADWSSAGSPVPALTQGVLCSQHGCPGLRLQQEYSSFPDFQNYLFSLHLVLSLAVQLQLLGLKPAHICLQK